MRAEPRLRDGLLLLAPGDDEYSGDFITFAADQSESAYATIAGFEPRSLYRWGEIDVLIRDRSERANVLLGKSPYSGSEPWFASWKSRDDPFFVEALDVVTATAEEAEEGARNATGDPLNPDSLRSFFQSQMAYLLLWAAIERFATLRYGFGEKAHQRVLRLADEPAFVSALQRVVPPVSPDERREVRRADKPSEVEHLDPADPRKALRYYYQVRSNIAHRGKGRAHERMHVEVSLSELLAIFRSVLDSTIAKPR